VSYEFNDEAEAERQRQEYGRAKPNGSDTSGPIDLGEWDFGEDNEPIPPRGWLLGTLLCRQFLSSLFGDGAVGKTAFMIVMALSLATGRNLIGEYVFVRCRVLLICFEDGKDELRRRITAAMLHYGISKADIRGHLFITTISRGDAKLASARNGEIIAGKLGDALDRSIIRRQADALFLDPFIKTHAVGENDNAAIDFVAEILSDLAIRHNCAPCAPHHTRKGSADPGNADIGRGAGSLKDAFRLCYTLTPMSKEEAELFAIGAEERVSLIRLDNGKVNLVRRTANARWFKLVSVSLGNGTDIYPNGDEVQTVERWTPPNLWAEITIILTNQILHRIAAGNSKGQRYSSAPQAGKDRAAWMVVREACPKLSEAQAKEVIKTWIETETIKEADYDDPVRRETIKGLIVLKYAGDTWNR
jgi:AAA domain